MRLEILNNGYSIKTKLLFKLIQFFSKHPVPDAAKLVFYRPDFYGAPMKKFTHEAMRGDSEWAIGDRELMAAYISKVNQCPFCIGAHTATASLAYNDEAIVASVLSNLETTPIDEPLKATLKMLGKLTRENKINAEDIHKVLSAGVTPKQIEDAFAICFAFNVTDRLANTFGFEELDVSSFKAGAKFLLKHGYK
jgi:uncharacterized peroxidase-related enzyme